MQIHFDITGDNSGLVKSLNDTQQRVENVAAVFTRLGKDGFDIKGGAEANIKLLSQRIDALSDSAEKSRATINRWAQDAAELLGNGDVQGFRVINEDIQEESKNLQELTAEVEEYKAVLDTLKSYQGGELVGNTDKMENVRMRMRQLTQEVANYTIELSRMTEEERNSAKGQELQKKLNQAKKEAGELKDVMGDVNREINAIASDTGSFDALAEGINLVSSGFGAAAGFAAMFGVEEERLQEIQTTLQASLAISNALTVVQNNLQAESAIMGKVRAAQDLASAAAINIKAAAEGKGVIATTAATAAQWLFNKAANANPYVLLASAIISVVGALYLFTGKNKDAAEAEKKNAEEAEKLKAKIEAVNKAYSDQVQGSFSVASQLRNLQKAYRGTNDEIKKTSILKSAQEHFKKLGIECKNLNNAQSLLLNQGTAVIKMLELQGTAAALSTLRMEAFKKSFENMRSNGYSVSAAVELASSGREVRELDNAILRVNAQVDKIKSTLPMKTGGSGKTTNRDNTKNDAAEKSQRLADLVAKQEMESARKRAEAMIAAQEYIIKTREKNTDTEIASINLAYEKERQAIERDKQAAIAAHEQAARELWEAQNPDANKNGKTWQNTGKKGKTFTLTEEEDAMFKARERANEKATADALDKVYTKETKAQREYLREFGNLVQQENAIREEYAEKRRQIIEEGGGTYALAQNDAAMQEALSALHMDALQADINWEEVFSNLDYVSTEHLERLRTQLRAALDMGDITAENARIITEKLNEIDKQIQQKRSVWGQLFGDANQGVGGIVNAIRDQKALNADAAQKRAEANKATSEAFALSAVAEMVKKNKGEDSEEYLKAQRKAEEADKDAKKRGQAAEIASGMAGNGALAMTGAIIHGVNDNVQSFAEAAQLLGGKDSEFVKSAAKFAESSQFATDGFEKFKSGDFIGAALSVGQAVNSLGETFGMWSNSNVEEKKAENDKLARAMSVNTEALNRLTKAMQEGTATEKYANYEAAKAVKEQNMRANAAILSNLDSMYDGHHSTEYYFNDKGGEAHLKAINRILNTNYQTLYDLYMSPQRLAELYDSPEGRQALQDLTQTLADAESAAGMEGNNIVQELTQHISEYSDEAYNELHKAFQQAVTGVSFDNFKSNFKSALMDMSKDSKDFADDFTKSLTQSLLDTQFENTFNNKLTDLYNEWEAALGDDNLTASEVASLQGKQEELAQRMLKLRNQVAAVTGYDDISTSEASGSINSAKSMSEDTANELIGRMTAVQIAVEGIRSQDNVMAQQVINGVTALMSITSVSASNNEVLNAILLQHVQSNSYLEDISKYNKAIYSEWGSQINAIRTKIDTL